MGCGRRVPISYFACPYCGRPVVATSADKKNTSYPLIAGIFEILSGISGLILAAFFVVLASFSSYYSYYFPAFICGGVVGVFGILALIGGIFCLQRKNYGMALVGAIFSLFSGGILFGVLAIIFTVLGKDEFK